MKDRTQSKIRLSSAEALARIYRYCAYQERSHREVKNKLYEYGLYSSEVDELLSRLITEGFLNEERFAIAFASGKHRIKHWGKQRISAELKLRNISSRIITTALNEISTAEYLDNFNKLAEKIWAQTSEQNLLLKKKKSVDFLLRKGYETSLIYDKIQELSFE